MRLSPRTRGYFSLVQFFVLMGLISWGYLWAYSHWLTPFLVPRMGMPVTTARQTLSFLQVPALGAVTMAFAFLWIKFVTMRVETRGATETLRFEPSVLQVRALPPFKAQTASVKPSKIWFLVVLTVITLALNFPFRASGSGSITGVFELLTLVNTWLSSRVSPLQLSADGICIDWRRTLNWAQVARAEIWKSPIGKSYRVRFFDANNRKIGQIIGLNSPDEWPVVLDYLHARAGN